MPWIGPARERQDGSTCSARKAHPAHGRIPPRRVYYVIHANKSMELRNKPGTNGEEPSLMESYITKFL